MTPCVEHKQKGTKHGYGMGTWNKQHAPLHRIVYCKAHGISLDSIKGMVVMHACDNPRCINPDHLSLGTQSDNVQDMLSKGRGSWLKGSERHNSKLEESSIALIRERLASGVPQGEVAEEFGVCRSTISRIKCGKRWSHA